MKQKGFTLMELLLALFISAVLLSVGVAVIYQTYTTTRDARGLNTILVDLDTATSRIRKDVYSAHDTINLFEGVPTEGHLALEWTNYAAGNATGGSGILNSCNFTLSNTTLLRSYHNGDTVVESIVGRNITKIIFTRNGRSVDVVITATSGGALPISRSIKFSAYMRSEGVN